MHLVERPEHQVVLGLGQVEGQLSATGKTAHDLFSVVGQIEDRSGDYVAENQGLQYTATGSAEEARNSQ